ncbi:MAG TPA: hypothetical protein VJU16_09340 [Planctomycetota bacterium]|nr:hypothetical protein [Planctomycetota bacterium]
MALKALILLAAWMAAIPDVMPKGVSDPVIAVEKLGGGFQSKGTEDDRGLKVSVWWNLALEREERWHCTEAGEWFLRARPGIFVLAGTGEGGWHTNPLERIVHRDGKWKRITLPEKR